MKKKEYPLLIADCVIVGDIMYFFAKNYNALYSIDLKTRYRTFLGRIPNEKKFAADLVGKVHYFKNRIWLIPRKMRANKIWIYSIENAKWNFIEIDLGQFENSLEKIAYSFIYNESLVLVGCYYNGIIKIGLETTQVKYYKNFFGNVKDICSLYYCEVDNDNLLIPSPDKNQVIKVNLHSFEYEAISIGDKTNIFSGICRCGDEYWLSPRKASPYIVKWDGKNKYQEYKVPDDIKKNGQYIFCGIGKIDNDIYMFGGKGKRTLVFSSDNYYDQIIIPKSYAVFKHGGGSYILQDYDGNVVYAMRGKKQMIHLAERNIELDSWDVHDDVIYESDYVDLPVFMNLIVGN